MLIRRGETFLDVDFGNARTWWTSGAGTSAALVDGSAPLTDGSSGTTEVVETSGASSTGSADGFIMQIVGAELGSKSAALGGSVQTTATESTAPTSTTATPAVSQPSATTGGGVMLGASASSTTTAALDPLADGVDEGPFGPDPFAPGGIL